MKKLGKSEVTAPMQADVARRLQAVFVALELRPKDIAIVTGCGVNTVSQWLGRGSPRTIALVPAIRLCSEYGITLDFIYRDSNSGMPYDLVRRVRSAEAEIVRRKQDASSK